MIIRKELPYLAVRVIGILSALWMIYAIAFTHLQIHQKTLHTDSAHYIQSQVFWNTSLPLALLAILFLLPYKKLSRRLAWLSVLLIISLGAHLILHFFGVYLLAYRLPAGGIPVGTIIAILVLLAVLLSQILGLLYYTRAPRPAP